MKVAIYCRVSTDDKEQDPARQIDKCQQYCDLNNHEVVDIIKEYHTGDSDPFSRPKLKDIRQTEIKGIVVFSIDRFTRQHPTKVLQMLNQMKNEGIMIISVTEPVFNMESEFVEVLQFILTWFNNYYLIKLKRDIKSGMEKAKKEGKHIGRPKVEFNVYRAKHLLFVEKKSQREAAKELGVSVATINRFKRIEQGMQI